MNLGNSLVRHLINSLGKKLKYTRAIATEDLMVIRLPRD